MAGNRWHRHGMKKLRHCHRTSVVGLHTEDGPSHNIQQLHCLHRKQYCSNLFTMCGVSKWTKKVP